MTGVSHFHNPPLPGGGLGDDEHQNAKLLNEKILNYTHASSF
jgi:hypothetical protein